MIINIDAFKKEQNIINQDQDKLNGETAMHYIRDTNPIVIIDEPQSVDNTDKSKDAIKNLNPLCILRYSATHKQKINLLYSLNPVDAYQMGLVKQICVASQSVENDFNKPYIFLKSVSHKNKFTASIEMDIKGKNGNIERKSKTVNVGDDLYQISGERDLYQGYVLEVIDCTKNFERVEFANSEIVNLGKAIGSIDENIIKRSQIYRTIETHFDKELRYYSQGIKVLSLFFIDEVKKYRTETGDKGIYAEMFEECYKELISKPKYAVLKKYFGNDVSKVHDGYFSQDKKGVYKNTKGDTQLDDSTYNIIMKDKEYLLSFECPMRFIFSHSALKEGWDNPNVFQVCTLLDQKSTFTCRQKIGRGLRLAVNQAGERIEDKNINILHVMANESFAEFAQNLQNEIENETGIKFTASNNKLSILDDNKKVNIKLKKQVMLSPEFNEIWDRIKQKTTYRINFDVDKLVKQCIEEIKSMPTITPNSAKLISKIAEIDIKNDGVIHQETYIKTHDVDVKYDALPDIIRLISTETLLKRATIIKIIEQSGRVEDFINNPQLFYEKIREIILTNRHSLAIDGIKYVKLAGETYYAQEIFDVEELTGYLDKNAVAINHGVYDYLIYDSEIENQFAKSLDNDPDVKMFFKLPPKFKIETPIGAYNPDWAVLLEKNGDQKMYFVLETKGTTNNLDLRVTEQLKIHCGKKHFDTLKVNFQSEPVKDWMEFKSSI